MDSYSDIDSLELLIEVVRDSGSDGTDLPTLIANTITDLDCIEV